MATDNAVRSVAKPREMHGATHTRLYRAWRNMRNRCRYDCADRAGDYKQRGITVCDEWVDSFENFREWALVSGYSDSLTIDRIDNDRGYSPDNCRWVDRTEQSRNRRNAISVTAWGETKTLGEWSEDSRAAVQYGTIWDRLKRGLPPEEAIASPRRKNQHK